MQNILEENRARGWIQVPDTAPAWVREALTEFRTAELNERPVAPAFARRYNREAEIRCARAEANRSILAMARPRVVIPPVKKASALSFREAAQLAKQYGVAIEDVNVARSLEQTSGVPMADTLNRIHLRAITARVERAAQLRKEDDLDDDDPDSDWNEKAHERAATRHRALAQKASLDAAIKHFAAADAHDSAAKDFTRANSRKARAASKAAMPLSEVS
jgi:hypothetical protein